MVILEGLEGTDFVTCLECGRRLKVVNRCHLKLHNITSEEYKKKYPGVRTQSGITHKARSRSRRYGKMKKQLTGTEGTDFVICLECRGRYKGIDMHLRRVHNMSSEQYIKKHPGARLVCLGIAEKFKKTWSIKYNFVWFMRSVDRLLSPLCACGCDEQVSEPYHKYIYGHNSRGKQPWNKDLTKETDPRVKKYGDTHHARHVSGELKSWNKGENHPELGWSRDLTKETDPRVARHSKTLSERYATGEIEAWNKDLTKETHPGLAAMSAKAILRWSNPEWVEGLSGETFWGIESKHHGMLKQVISFVLEGLGYEVQEEKWCTIDDRRYIVDIWAQRSDRKIVVEVGGCSDKKFIDLRKIYGDDNVLHVQYRSGFKEELISLLEDPLFG